MPKHYPPEFKRDVVAVARTSGPTQEEIAQDFGDLDPLGPALGQAGRRRRRHHQGHDQRRAGRAERVEASQPGARARGRDPASRDRVPCQGRGPRTTYPLVLDLAPEGIPVTVTCRVLGFSTAWFYKWRANPVSQRDWGDRT
jgi:putative transposase